MPVPARRVRRENRLQPVNGSSRCRQGVERVFLLREKGQCHKSSMGTSCFGAKERVKGVVLVFLASVEKEGGRHTQGDE